MHKPIVDLNDTLSHISLPYYIKVDGSWEMVVGSKNLRFFDFRFLIAFGHLGI